MRLERVELSCCSCDSRVTGSCLTMPQASARSPRALTVGAVTRRSSASGPIALLTFRTRPERVVSAWTSLVTRSAEPSVEQSAVAMLPLSTFMSAT